MKGSELRLSQMVVQPTALRSRADTKAYDLGELYRCYAPAVARFAARMAGPSADVEDLVHDVFVVVANRIGSFRGESSITTWLYGITINVVRLHRRRERRCRQLDDACLAAGGTRGPATPAEELERKEAASTVHSALARIGEKYRVVLLLHELEGLTGPEIAMLTSVKPATVWVRLHRARSLFLEALQSERAVAIARALRPIVILLFWLSCAAVASALTWKVVERSGTTERPITHRRHVVPPPRALSRPSTERIKLDPGTHMGKKETMEGKMRMLSTVLITTAALAASTPALAVEEKEEKAEVRYSARTELTFSDVTVTGQVTRPNDVYILVRGRVKFPLLVRVRTSFAPELLSSVEKI